METPRILKIVNDTIEYRKDTLEYYQICESKWVKSTHFDYIKGGITNGNNHRLFKC